MLFIYISAYFLGAILYYLGYNIIASGLMIALAIFLYVKDFVKYKRVINIRGIFGLSFIGGFGLSLLKLSNLSGKYSIMTFVVVFAAYFSLYFGVYLFEKKSCLNINQNDKLSNDIKQYKANGTFPIVLICITLLAFVIEAFVLGFIPFFTKDTPHAYSTFHIFGLHYITTLYSFIPAVAICDYFLSSNKKKSICIIVISYIYVIAMSIFLISRSELIISVFLSLFTLIIGKNKEISSLFIKENKNSIKISKKVIGSIFICVLLFIVLYVVITINRAHDIEYLNSIFDMKDKNMPIFITQPYMYISHNFENLNYMIDNIQSFTFGRRILFPFFTLTFMKKFFPLIADIPTYIIKEELSTKTLVYDFYFDFGLVGVIVFCFIIGYVLKMVEEKVYYKIENNTFMKSNYYILLFALLSYYMAFSFFQTYFSLTDTWVHIIFILLAILFVG